MTYPKNQTFRNVFSIFAFAAAASACTAINDPGTPGWTESDGDTPALSSTSPILGDQAKVAVSALGITSPVSLRLSSGTTVEVLSISADGDSRFDALIDLGATFELTIEGGAPCLLDRSSGVVEHTSRVALTCDGVAALGGLDFGAYVELKPAFDPEVLEYTLDASSFASWVHVDAQPMYADADVQLDGDEPDGYGALTTITTLNPADSITTAQRVITVGVVSELGFSRTYRVTVNRDHLPEAKHLMKAEQPAPNDHHGASIAMAGVTLVVGAPDADVNGLADAGAVHVYRYEADGWHLEKKLVSTIPTAGAHFGAAVATDGSNIVVGVPSEGSSAGGIYYTPGSGKPGSGAIEIFRRSEESWFTVAWIKRPTPMTDDAFGRSVAIRGGHVFVGAPGVDASASLVNSGAVYAYQLSGSTVTSFTFATPNRVRANHQFGHSLAAEGEYVVVGAIGDSSPHPNSLDQTVPNSGAAYLFQRGASSYTHRSTLKHPYPSERDYMGYAVALVVKVNQPTVYVGVPKDDASTPMGNDNNAPDAGSVLEFRNVATSMPLPDAGFNGSPVRAGNEIGRALAVDESWLAVGYVKDTRGANGINPTVFSVMPYVNSGAVTLLPRAQNPYGVQLVKSALALPEQLFGSSVAIGPAGLVVGAPNEASPVSGVAAPVQSQMSALQSGGVYFYR